MKNRWFLLALCTSLLVLTACGPSKSSVSAKGVIIKIITTEDATGKNIDLFVSGPVPESTESCSIGGSGVSFGPIWVQDVPLDGKYQVGGTVRLDCPCGSFWDIPACRLAP